MVDLLHAAASHPHLRRQLRTTTTGTFVDVIFYTLFAIVIVVVSSYDGIKTFFVRRRLRSAKGFEKMVVEARSKPQEKFTDSSAPFVPFEGDFDVEIVPHRSLCWALCLLSGLACKGACNTVTYVCCCGVRCFKLGEGGDGEGDGEEEDDQMFSFVGTFKVAMTDNGKGTYRLKGGSTRLKGGSTFADGLAAGPGIIVDGSADRAGNAWWVEERAGARVLTEGKFDYSDRTFEGSWWANDGTYGSYAEFAEKKGTELPAPAGSAEEGEATATQTLQQMLEADRPTG